MIWSLQASDVHLTPELGWRGNWPLCHQCCRSIGFFSYFIRDFYWATAVKFGVNTVPADVCHYMQLSLRVVDLRLGTALALKRFWGLTVTAGERLAAPGTARAGLDALVTAWRISGTLVGFCPSGTWESQQQQAEAEQLPHPLVVMKLLDQPWIESLGFFFFFFKWYKYKKCCLLHVL